MHLQDPSDGIFATRAVKSAIRDGRDDVAYQYGDGADAMLAYVKKNKTGYTVYVQPANNVVEDQCENSPQ